ncbi:MULTISPECIES: hypothetical protein [Lacrimispora]|uniref:Uncharacterized protein n=1 Tax=Lacrimispora xylanolytica TaxID=29375 RepID=A0ABY7AIS2_9FIRM|nr:MULTISPECIES: hypothetical protein [Lacrimispora]WAJ25698.1 hypothetical protein OW255_09355 [Lacrimispora xylanolytica]
MDQMMIVKKRKEELIGEVIGMVTAIADADGIIIMMMTTVDANMKRSGRSTGDRDLPPNNTGARKHLSTTLLGMYV